MKYQDEFRNRELVQGLAAAITRDASALAEPVRFMEVCGTHTMAIARFGLKSLLPPMIKLVSGPGCPVCVTPVSYIDHAIALSGLPDTIITTFGDLLRVPGSRSSLQAERANGSDIRIVHSPLDAVRLAAAHPAKQVVFLGVGFETTTPAVGCAILKAETEEIGNFYVLAAHKTMPAPMKALSSDPGLKIRGYLCPAHVSTVTGADAYRPLAEQYHIPCVVTGFEPADILQGLQMLLRQHLSKQANVEIQYSRAVSNCGNLKAQGIIRQVFKPVDAVWRGLGLIQDSGLEIRESFRRFDASKVIPVSFPAAVEPEGCRCGDVLTGRIKPADCSLFNTACTQETPVGACMVSSEGSCAAASRYDI